MDKIIALLLFLVGVFIAIVTYPDQAAAVLTLAISAGIAVIIIQNKAEDVAFLQRIFLIALLLRLFIGLVVSVTGTQEFFGGDAVTYDENGYRLYQIWFEGVFTNDAYSQRALSTSVVGWGMNYLVASIYTFTGRNPLAAQFFCLVIGAVNSPMIYVCAQKMFNNKRVSRLSAILIAVFPAFVIWSSQLLKDGLIIFLLLLAMTMVMKLHEKFNYFSLFFLTFSLFGVFALRFYIFFMVCIAVLGGFVIGTSASNQSILKRLVAMVVIGISLTYLGVLRTAGENLDNYGSLEKINLGRKDMADRADSGFNKDADVSTADGAISTLPIGFTYLMFAPFPWQVNNIRQAIVLPEVFVWWALMPLLVSGLIYTIRNHFRAAMPVLLFALMLTLGYSIFQGNVGTAYRQRTQIQVFLFIFIAVGWVLKKEKKENLKMETAIKRKQFQQGLVLDSQQPN